MNKLDPWPSTDHGLVGSACAPGVRSGGHAVGVYAVGVRSRGAQKRLIDVICGCSYRHYYAD